LADDFRVPAGDGFPTVARETPVLLAFLQFRYLFWRPRHHGFLAVSSMLPICKDLIWLSKGCPNVKKYSGFFVKWPRLDPKTASTSSLKWPKKGVSPQLSATEEVTCYPEVSPQHGFGGLMALTDPCSTQCGIVGVKYHLRVSSHPGLAMTGLRTSNQCRGSLA
jgi:hypothetical protein